MSLKNTPQIALHRKLSSIPEEVKGENDVEKNLEISDSYEKSNSSASSWSPR